MTWDPVFDDQPTASVGAVSVAPSNPNHVWVGTGEPANRQSSPWGVGVFKSTDAGGTWTHVGLEDTRHISRIRIDPRDPGVVYVGAMGHLWGPNEERGLFKTTDGGATWENILHIDEHTGIIDLVMDHNDPNTLFAATYQRQRTGFGFAACGARRTPGRTGPASGRDCRRANWAASGSTSTGGTATSCTRSWRRMRARACTAPPTAAKRGSS